MTAPPSCLCVRSSVSLVALRTRSHDTCMSEKRLIRVFIASPGGLEAERRAFGECVDELNAGFGEGADIEFKALGWENTLASTGRRSQSVINQEIDRCDIFILTMHVRWGQEAPDSGYSSYTEEEFHRALVRFKETNAPEIFVLFKSIPTLMRADPGEQLQKVLDFRKGLEDTRQVLYREYNEPEQFSADVVRHLRAFAKGELSRPDESKRDVVVLPIESVEAVREAKEETSRERERAEAAEQEAEAAAAKAEELALTAAHHAAQAALDGHIEEARQTFAKVIDSTSNLDVMFLAFDFYRLTGDLDTAEQLCERRLALSGPDSMSAETARALGNLGVICETRGDLVRAEEMHRKSLAINQPLDHQEGIARDSSNLGVIYETRGDLDRAEEMYRKALDINAQLDHQEGIARDRGHLGLVYAARGDLDRAEEEHRKALDINEELGHREGIAANCTNLGMIYQTREDLGNAQKMSLKALAIHEQLSHQQGIAANCGNLAQIFRTRGDLNRAEEWFLKILDIHEQLDHQQGIAADYANLGGIAKDRGDIERAQDLWTRAKDLYSQIGMQPNVEDVQGWLDELDAES